VPKGGHDLCTLSWAGASALGEKLPVIQESAFITSNTVYVVRNGRCVAVYDEMGLAHAAHPALGLAVTGRCEMRGDQLHKEPGEPEVGQSLCFDDRVVTSAVKSIRRLAPNEGLPSSATSAVFAKPFAEEPARQPVEASSGEARPLGSLDDEPSLGEPSPNGPAPEGRREIKSGLISLLGIEDALPLIAQGRRRGRGGS